MGRVLPGGMRPNEDKIRVRQRAIRRATTRAKRVPSYRASRPRSRLRSGLTAVVHNIMSPFSHAHTRLHADGRGGLAMNNAIVEVQLAELLDCVCLLPCTQWRYIKRANGYTQRGSNLDPRYAESSCDPLSGPAVDERVAHLPNHRGGALSLQFYTI